MHALKKKKRSTVTIDGRLPGFTRGRFLTYNALSAAQPCFIGKSRLLPSPLGKS
jgi:hypothetical protein